MKPGIHPEYHTDATVTCACGHTFKTGSTVKEINTELCSNCHPFYTGKDKLVDTAGRVDRFKRIMEAKDTVAKTRGSKKAKKAKSAARKAKVKKEDSEKAKADK